MAYKVLVIGVKVDSKVRGKTKHLSFSDKECLNVVITNLIICEENNSILLYSRDTGGRVMKWKHNHKGISGYRVVQAVGWLESEGYVINTVASAYQLLSEKKNMSYLATTGKFLKQFGGAKMIEVAKVAIREATPVLMFRDKEGDLKYRDTQVNITYENNMRLMNNSNSRFDVRDEHNAVVDTLYSRKFRECDIYNGRMYSTQIMLIENYETKGRLKIKADSTIMTECDFNAMHCWLLADTYGYTLPDGDAYMNMLPDDMKTKQNRQVVKRCFVVMLNCPSKASAMISFRVPMDEVEGHIFKKPSEIMDVIYNFLGVLTEQLYKDRIGLRLCKTESDIMTDVVQFFVSQGKVALPIHDSCLVMLEDEELLATTMSGFYKQRMNVDRVIMMSSSKIIDGVLYKEDCSC